MSGYIVCVFLSAPACVSASLCDVALLGEETVLSQLKTDLGYRNNFRLSGKIKRAANVGLNCSLTSTMKRILKT